MNIQVVCLLTEAFCWWRACLAKQATWLMIGEKLVGPQNLSWGKHCWYACSTPSMPAAHR